MNEASAEATARLEKAIQKWMDGLCAGDGKAWEAFDTYVPENMARLMAKAAMQPLLACASLSEYLRGDGHDV